MAKIINGRFVQKHDIEANWLKATGFIPLDGELIVYEADETCAYPRFKVGDGATNVNDLPFVANPVQGDWNQNDPNAPDYVKNRTHWEDGLVLPETELARFEAEGQVGFIIPTPFINNPEFDKTYTVTCNGDVYECKAFDAFHEGPEPIMIGNTGLLGGLLGDEDTGEPFLIVLYPSGNYSVPTGETGYGAIMMNLTPDSVTLSIVEKDAPVHKLDPKFLPDTVIMAERPQMGQGKVILPETELDVNRVVTDEFNPDGFGQYSLVTPLENRPAVGGTCKLTWGGTEYTGKVADMTDTVGGGVYTCYAMGNAGLVGEVPDGFPNPDPNAIVFLAMFPDGFAIEEGMTKQYAMMFSQGITPEPPILSITEIGNSTPKQLVMDKDGNVKWEDRTHWVEGGTIDILPEITITTDEEIEAAMTTPLRQSLIEGETYQVNYNGTVYECVCLTITVEGMTIPVLGNVAAWDVGLAGGNPDAPFVFMEIPTELVAALGGMCWQLIEFDPPNSLTFGIKYNGEVIHKIDNKFLDIANPDWNALPGTAGYIENRTHYCDYVVMTYDSTKLADAETMIANTGGNILTYHKISDYVIDATIMGAASCVLTDLLTGEQQTAKILAVQDNNGFSVGAAAGFLMYSISNPVVAAEAGLIAPSAGTYVRMAFDTPCIFTIDAGEIIKKLDEKYLPQTPRITVTWSGGWPLADVPFNVAWAMTDEQLANAFTIVEDGHVYSATAARYQTTDGGQLIKVFYDQILETEDGHPYRHTRGLEWKSYNENTSGWGYTDCFDSLPYIKESDLNHHIMWIDGEWRAYDTEAYKQKLGVSIPTPDDALALMIEMGFIDPIVDESGAMYTDANGEIFTY